MINLSLRRSFNPNDADPEADYKALNKMTKRFFNPMNQWYVGASLSLAGAILDVFIPGDQF